MTRKGTQLNTRPYSLTIRNISNWSAILTVDPCERTIAIKAISFIFRPWTFNRCVNATSSLWLMDHTFSSSFMVFETVWWVSHFRPTYNLPMRPGQFRQAISLATVQPIPSWVWSMTSWCRKPRSGTFGPSVISNKSFEWRFCTCF